MKITSREIIIAAIAILVLLGIGYVINNNNNKKADTKTEDNVNLDENNSTDSSSQSSSDENNGDSNVETVTPAPDSTVDSKPDQITVKFKKAIKGGSEIKVVSASGVDVVPGANTLSADGKTLVVPVAIVDSGAYKVAYSYCLEDGTCKTGTYTFTVK